jgi:DtxR family transcriptional regulator, manganese transport regulator
MLSAPTCEVNLHNVDDITLCFRVAFTVGRAQAVSRRRWLVCALSRSIRGKSEADTAELPAELTQARRFGKTRSARSGALLEDYVELIADLLANRREARPTDVARRLGVSHATAIKTIARLKREGLATGRPYRGVFLTEEGERLAARVRARHRLVVNVLLALGVPTEAAEADAEGIEHYVSEATLRAFAQFLESQARA